MAPERRKQYKVGVSLVSADRFQLEEFADYRRSFQSEVELIEHRIATLLDRSAVPIDSPRAGEASTTGSLLVRVHLANSSCASVARNLIDLDVELRRTAVFLTSGGTRPAAGNQVVTVVCASRSLPIEVVLRVGEELRDLFTSHPLVFLETLEWFWLHRHTRTKVRTPDEKLNPTCAWEYMLRVARDLATRAQLVDVSIDVDFYGNATFGFRGIS